MKSDFDFKFQSTLPMRGATFVASLCILISKISIHTPHAGSDYILFEYEETQIYFNPHSPCGERPKKVKVARGKTVFQSTLPMRGATLALGTHLYFLQDFNPHSPCGERPSAGVAVRRRKRKFQSTLPMRGATAEMRVFLFCQEFQSTLPMRGATQLRTL